MTRVHEPKRILCFLNKEEHKASNNKKKRREYFLKHPKIYPYSTAYPANEMGGFCSNVRRFDRKMNGKLMLHAAFIFHHNNNFQIEGPKS